MSALRACSGVRCGPLALATAMFALLVMAPGTAQAEQQAKHRLTVMAASVSASGTGSLESAAAKASTVGRAVAMSLIGLALAIAATVLAFRRDFKEAAGVFAVGVVAVLLATPTGLELLRATVVSLFGGK